uniref:Fem-3 mRNA-binding factor 2 n=1 Tax=Ascaris suum TaxID=6253 RepID=F1KXF2_ASCSU
MGLTNLAPCFPCQFITALSRQEATPLGLSCDPTSAMVRGVQNGKNSEVVMTSTLIEHLINSLEDNPDDAMCRNAYRFLIESLSVTDIRTRCKIYDYAMNPATFVRVSKSVLGSLLLQELVQRCEPIQLKGFIHLLQKFMVSLSCSRNSAHVMEKIWERMDVISCSLAACSMKGFELSTAVHPIGNHTIQAIIARAHFCGYGPIIHMLSCSEETFRTVVQDRYGHRVLLCALEKMESQLGIEASRGLNRLLDRVAKYVAEMSDVLACHRYGNYVVQRVIVLKGFSQYRLMMAAMFRSKLLWLSQEKFGSHIVQKLLQYGEDEVGYSMMNELLDEYECNSEGMDALEVLMFDQFGNYVLQTMLELAADVLAGRRKGKREWLSRLVYRIICRQSELIPYSSGKTLLAKATAMYGPANKISGIAKSSALVN